MLERVLSPLYRVPLVRRAFWTLAAGAVEGRWGRETGDYPVLERVVRSRPLVRRVLDVGCGRGRLFPVYQALGVEEVVGQDITRRALRRAAAAAPGLEVRLLCRPIERLDFPDAHFDLIVSNRVLQHIPPGAIAATVQTLCRLGRAVYVNELTDSDGVPGNAYLVKHDYPRLFAAHGFVVAQAGMLDRQTWRLFERTHDRAGSSREEREPRPRARPGEVA